MKRILFLTLITCIASQQISAMQNQQPNKCALISQGILKTTVGSSLLGLGTAVAASGPYICATGRTFMGDTNNPAEMFAKVLVGGTAIIVTPITAPLGAWAAVKGAQLTRSGYNDIKSGLKQHQS